MEEGKGMEERKGMEEGKDVEPKAKTERKEGVETGAETRAGSTASGRMDRGAFAAWILTALSICVLSWLLWRTSSAVGGNAWFDPYNGTFQNFNSIRRMFSGAFPYRDYGDPLGAGVTFWNLFFTWPIGHDYVSSRLGSAFSHVAAFVASGLLLGRLSGIPFSVSLFLASAMAAGAHASLPLLSLGGLLDPGDSSTGARALAPPIAALLLILARRTKVAFVSEAPAVSEAAAIGAAAGLAAIWAPDYPAALLAASWFLHCVWRPLPWRGRVVSSSALAAAFASAWFLAACLVTGGAPLAYFHFLSEIGTYNAGFFMPDASRAYHFFWPLADAAVVSAPILMFFLARIARRERSFADALFFFLIASELVSILVKVMAYDVYSRHEAPLRREFAYFVLYALPALFASLPRFERWAAPARFLLPVLLAAGFLIPALSADDRTLLGSHQAADADRKAERIEVPELGGSLVRAQMDLVEEGRRLRAEGIGKAVMTYRTALAEVAGFEPASHADYIIHAVSPSQIAAYAKDLIDADSPIAVTTDRDWNGYEAWLERKSWAFYRELFLRYAPAERATYSQVWRKRPIPLSPAAIPLPCSIHRSESQPRAFEIEYDARPLAGGGDWYVEARPIWTWSGPGRLFVSIDEGATRLDSSLGLNLSSVWSMDARRLEQAQPLILRAGETTKVRYMAYGFAEDSFEVRSCSASAFLPLSEARPRMSGEGVRPIAIQRVWRGPFGVELIVADPAEGMGIHPGDEIILPSGVFKVVSLATRRIALSESALDSRFSALSPAFVRSRPADMRSAWIWAGRNGIADTPKDELDAAFDSPLEGYPSRAAR